MGKRTVTIVERLRKPVVSGFTHPIDRERAEAANEIERLQRLTAEYDRLDIERIAEIERLRALVNRGVYYVLAPDDDGKDRFIAEARRALEEKT